MQGLQAMLLAEAAACREVDGAGRVFLRGFPWFFLLLRSGSEWYWSVCS